MKARSRLTLTQGAEITYFMWSPGLRIDFADDLANWQQGVAPQQIVAGFVRYGGASQPNDELLADAGVRELRGPHARRPLLPPGREAFPRPLPGDDGARVARSR